MQPLKRDVVHDPNVKDDRRGAHDLIQLSDELGKDSCFQRSAPYSCMAVAIGLAVPSSMESARVVF